MIPMKRKSLLSLISLTVIFLVVSCYSGQSQMANLDDCLVDFSQKIKGHQLRQGALPPDLNTEKFFSILETYYQDRECLENVIAYPVRVTIEDDSYVLILCDKESKFVHYKDLGKTTDFVDFPYYRQQKLVPCNNN